MQFQRVVAGVDFGQPSLHAVEWASRHLAAASELILAHSIHVPPAPHFMRGGYPDHDQLSATLREGAESRLQELAQSLDHPKVRIEIREGKPSEQMCAIAEEVEADLVVVGEHGPRRGIWNIMGSTAEKLLSNCDRPTLLARRLPDGSFQSILVAVDEDATGARALRTAHALAELFGAKVSAVHVVSDSLYWNTERTCGPEEARKVKASLQEQAHDWLAEEAGKAGFAPDCLDLEIASGQPDYAIPTAAERCGADLIVMGRPGITGVEGAVLGSATRSVIHYATCSVWMLERLDA